MRQLLVSRPSLHLCILSYWVGPLTYDIHNRSSSGPHPHPANHRVVHIVSSFIIQKRGRQFYLPIIDCCALFVKQVLKRLPRQFLADEDHKKCSSASFSPSFGRRNGFSRFVILTYRVKPQTGFPISMI